jgi:hypothetical protein
MTPNYHRKRIFLQVGAGAGDLDPRSNFRDGFTEYVKAQDRSTIDKIILVEPNPINIPKLVECWKGYPEASILQVGVCPRDANEREIEFFFTEEDAPHFHVFSMNYEHVRKHYPTQEIKSVRVGCVPFEEIIPTHEIIDTIALDIEGIDEKVLLETNWKLIMVKRLSFENLHISQHHLAQIHERLSNAGFIPKGSGFDVNGYDSLYERCVFPISFCVPKSKIIPIDEARANVLHKTKFLSDIIPGFDRREYKFSNEIDYYREYQQSYFATTCKKSGWDCLRHYEIVMNGCLPYFHDIQDAPSSRLFFSFPRDRLQECNELYNNHKDVPFEQLGEAFHQTYQTIMDHMMQFLIKNLTTEAMARLVLKMSSHEHVSSILFLSGDLNPDYLRCLLFHGFRSILGKGCHDYPRLHHMYKHNGIPSDLLYGRGFTYSNNLDPFTRDDARDMTITQDILNHSYDIIIYGSLHRGELPHYDIVSSSYKPEEIIVMCGEDLTDLCSPYHLPSIQKGHKLFVREFL